MVTGVVAGKQLTLRDLLLKQEVTVQELRGSTQVYFMIQAQGRIIVIPSM